MSVISSHRLKLKLTARRQEADHQVLVSLFLREDTVAILSMLRNWNSQCMDHTRTGPVCVEGEKYWTNFS